MCKEVRWAGVGKSGTAQGCVGQSNHGFTADSSVSFVTTGTLPTNIETFARCEANWPRCGDYRARESRVYITQYSNSHFLDIENLNDSSRAVVAGCYSFLFRSIPLINLIVQPTWCRHSPSSRRV